MGGQNWAMGVWGTFGRVSTMVPNPGEACLRPNAREGPWIQSPQTTSVRHVAERSGIPRQKGGFCASIATRASRFRRSRPSTPRVSIGRALIGDPALVLADEPTGNLDSKNSAEIIELLRAFNRDYHQTTIIITHDERIALQANRILAIEDGKITRDEVIRR